MFLEKILRIKQTLAFRLTFWYATIFTVSALGAFLIFYFTISSIIQDNIDEELLNDLVEFSSILAIKGDDSVATEMDIEAESDGVDKIFFRLVNTKGGVLGSSNMSSWEDVDISRESIEHVSISGAHVFKTISLSAYPHHVRILYGQISQGKILQIGKSLEDYEKFLETLQEIFGSTLAVLMVFSTLTGWFMARRALSGVEEVTRIALDMSKGAFEQRVQVKAGSYEIERLANAFNRMLDRIQELVAGMKEVTDDIAHDLKTPIARIRGRAESELISGKSGGGCQGLAADTIEECDGLLQMINTMLEISETETGVTEFARKEVDILQVIQKACELFQPISEHKGITIILKSPDRVFVSGDLNSLQRMIVSLLDNAIKYTPSRGNVTISLFDDNKQVVITIHDTGIGISQKDLPHIFKRFYRCEASRSEPGFGLGLSLALAIVRAHGGDFAVASTPGEGSIFTVNLPKA